VWSHELPDLAGTGNNLLNKVDDDRRGRFLENAIRSRDRLVQADRARDAAAATVHLTGALRMS
jgi:hypothetical protein